MKTARIFNLTLRTAFVHGDREVAAQVTLKHDGLKPVLLIATQRSAVEIPLARLARVAILQPHLLLDDL
jgi:hypothetical protein